VVEINLCFNPTLLVRVWGEPNRRVALDTAHVCAGFFIGTGVVFCRLARTAKAFSFVFATSLAAISSHSFSHVRTWLVWVYFLYKVVKVKHLIFIRYTQHSILKIIAPAFLVNLGVIRLLFEKEKSMEMRRSDVHPFACVRRQPLFSTAQHIKTKTRNCSLRRDIGAISRVEFFQTWAP
jgi:hypothetical protein